MKQERSEIFLDINSENGNVSLNGMNLVRVNAIDIHMKTGELTNVVIDIDTDGDRIKALINGQVQWLKEGATRQ